jgi:hypothetical protein
LDTISGVVFLATPHCKQADDWQRFALIFRPEYKTVNYKLISKEDFSALCLVALHFEELRLNIPILSIYETVPTKLRTNIFAARKEAIVREFEAPPVLAE